MKAILQGRDDRVLGRALVLHYVFKFATTVTAAFCIYLGYRLFVLGVTGQASLALSSKNISGQLVNAAPGLFFAVGGIAALIVIAWKGVDVELTPSSPAQGNEHQPSPRTYGVGGGGRLKK